MHDSRELESEAMPQWGQGTEGRNSTPKGPAIPLSPDPALNQATPTEATPASRLLFLRAAGTGYRGTHDPEQANIEGHMTFKVC